MKVGFVSFLILVGPTIAVIGIFIVMGVGMIYAFLKAVFTSRHDHHQTNDWEEWR